MPDGLEAARKITRIDGGAASVLVIENDPLMLTAMGSVLNMQGYRAVMARTEKVALESIQAGQFDAIVLSIQDLQAGCDFAHRLRSTELTKDIPVIFLVPELSADWCDKLARQGGVFSILKPFEPDSLIDLVDKVLWLPHVAKSRLGTRATHLQRQNDWISLSDS